MKKSNQTVLENKVIGKIDSETIKFQSKILSRLKLYDFTKTSIDFYSQSQTKEFIDYEFSSFKKKFSLISFKNDKSIKSINYKELTSFGKEIIRNELGDAIFILIMSLFENWYLSVFKLILIENKKNILNNYESEGINIKYIKDSNNIDDVYEKLIENYLSKIPYDGLKKGLTKLLREFKLNISDFPKDLIDIINEFSLCRNVIVHNDKIANGIYISKSGRFAKFKEGDTVLITESRLFNEGDYLLNFMQEFRKLIK